MLWRRSKSSLHDEDSRSFDQGRGGYAPTGFSIFVWHKLIMRAYILAKADFEVVGLRDLQVSD